MMLLANKLARWWLERQGCHVVRPGAVEMVLSGYFSAVQNKDGSYRVYPPFPHTFVVALNHSVVTFNREAREMTEEPVMYDV
jgi:hypothetical protein